MKKFCVFVLVILCGAPAIAVDIYPSHGPCQTTCNATCQSLIEAMHEGFYGGRPNCSNGAPGTGPQANSCAWDFSKQGHVKQSCGSAAVNGGAGCHSFGALKCAKPGGGYNFRTYTFDCSFNSAKGGMPVQTVDDEVGLCTYPDGSGFSMECSADGSSLVYGEFLPL